MHLFVCAFRAHHCVGAGKRGVAEVGKQTPVDIGQHADAHGVFHVDARADAAGNVDMLENRHVHIQRREHDVDGGEDRALGADERVDVDLGDRNFASGFALVGSCENVPAHAVLVVGDSVALADEFALRGDDGGAVELGNYIDDARTADADRLLPGVSDNGELRLHRIAVNFDCLDCTVGCAHAAGDIAALKCRTGGACARHHEVAVAEDQLAVGAEVDEQRKFILVPDQARERACGDIAADIRADVGRDENFGVGVCHKAEVLCHHPAPLEEGRDIRLHAHGVGIHTEKQVVHRRVGRDAGTENPVCRNAGGFAHDGR